MSNWDYTPEERTRVEAGDHRLVVLSAEEKTSKSGNRMIVVVFQPSGSDINISHYFVQNQYFNRNITDFFDSFGIERGDFVLPGWVGAIGAGRLKEDEQGYLKIAYFLDQKRAEKLPAWQGEEPERQTVTEYLSPTESEDLPFI